MRRFLCSVGLGLLFSAVLAGPAVAGKLPNTFVQLYRPAVARLQQTYSRLTAEGTISVDSPSTDQASEQRFMLRSDGERRRLDLRTTAQRNLGLKVGASTLKMATPIGSLNTYTNPGSKFFDNARERKYDGVVQDINRTCLLYLPYSFGTGGSILDTLQSSAVTIKSIKWIRTDGQAMVQITYDERGEHAGHSGMWHSTIVLSPDDGWGLRRFERSLATGSPKMTQRGVLTYATGADGVPLVQSIKVETRQNDQVTRVDAVNLTDITSGEPEGDFFTAYDF